MTVGQQIHARAFGERIHRLLAAVQHHDKRHVRRGPPRRQIKSVGKRAPGMLGVRRNPMFRAAPFARGPCGPAWAHARLAACRRGGGCGSLRRLLGRSLSRAPDCLRAGRVEPRALQGVTGSPILDGEQTSHATCP
jgi:hypothetical protein